jgi:hypothetical protein
MVDTVKAKGRGFWRWIRGNPVQTAVAILVLAGAGATAAISASPTAAYSGCGYGYAGSTGPSNTYGYGGCSTVTSGTPTAPSAPSNAVASSSGTSDSSSTSTGPVSSSYTFASGTNTVTTNGSGLGALTVSQYTANNESTAPSFGTAGQFFDVRASSGNAFTSVSVEECGPNVGTSVDWYDATTTTWDPVTGDPGPSSTVNPPNICTSFTLTSTSSPTVSELTGTTFATSQLSVSPSGAKSALAPVVLSVTPNSGPVAGGTAVTILGTNLSGASAVDFGTVPATSYTVVNANTIDAVSPAQAASAVNVLVTTVDGTNSAAPANQFTYTTTAPTPSTATEGYWEVASDGGIFSFGNALFHGSAGNITLNKPVVGMASTPNDAGYWLVASDGGIFSYGDAAYYGSLPGLPAADQPGAPVVGMAATADGKGYWEVTSKGDVYSFGDAAFHGSTGNITLNQPIVGMVATPNGGGYWLVAKDGGIFAFGNAAYDGSLPGLPAADQPGAPVVGMAATADGKGYWEVTSKGDVYSFGDATFHGSTGNITLNKPVVGMATSPDGGGYWLVASDGGIFAFGDADFEGSMGGTTLNAPVVGMAAS